MKDSKTKGKIVRSYGENIFGHPKFDRLLKRKAEVRGPRKRARRPSEFGRQLVEKQKLKFAYGLTERQFRNILESAKKMEGVTGHNFLSLLERRLDNTVFQAGMASTRKQARQFVSHGHFLLNNRRVNVPSITVKQDDCVIARNTKTTAELVRKQLSQSSGRSIPEWLAVSADTLSATITSMPTREHVTMPIEESLLWNFIPDSGKAARWPCIACECTCLYP